MYSHDLGRMKLTIAKGFLPGAGFVGPGWNVALVGHFEEAHILARSSDVLRQTCSRSRPHWACPGSAKPQYPTKRWDAQARNTATHRPRDPIRNGKANFTANQRSLAKEFLLTPVHSGRGINV